MITFLAGILRRDLTLLARHPLIWCLPILFFLSVVILFVMTVGISSDNADMTSPGIIWAAVLLACLLSQEIIFRRDYDSGFIEQILTSAKPLPLFVLAKVLTHWLVTGWPLITLVPLAALLLDLSSRLTWLLLAVLPLSTLMISLLSSLSAALTMTNKSHVTLGVLLIFPLAIPVVIFTKLTTHLAAMGLSPLPPMLLLASLTVLVLTLLPLAVASVLRAVGGS